MTLKSTAKKILSSKRGSIGQTEIHQVLRMRVQHAMLVGSTGVVVVAGEEALLADPPHAFPAGLSHLAGEGGVRPLDTAGDRQVLDATAQVPQDFTGGPPVLVPGAQSVQKAARECDGHSALGEGCPQL